MGANDWTETARPAPGYSNAGKVNTVTPTLSSISPTTAARNTTPTITATGTGFTRGSVITWNGVRQTTTYVSATSLTAAIALPNAAGSATVKVEETPDLVSGAQTFTIT